MAVTPAQMTTVSTQEFVGVYWRGDQHGQGCAEASSMEGLPGADPDDWYLNRIVITPPECRGSGIGGEMIERLKLRVAKGGGRRLLVEPGGYDSDLGVQVRFYEKHGFKRTGADHLWVCELLLGKVSGPGYDQNGMSAR